MFGAFGLQAPDNPEGIFTMPTEHWLVTTRHPTGYLDGVHRFSTKESGGWGGKTKWYATADKFGCSKDYHSAHDAIYGMCADHACTVLKIQKEE